MVALFKNRGGEEGLDARIAGLSRQRGRVDTETPAETSDIPAVEGAAPLLPKAAPGGPIGEHLAVAREELIARLGAEIKPERRKMLSRSDLAKLVSGAVQAYFVRHAIEVNPLSRRDLVADVIQALIAPDPAPGEALIGTFEAQLTGWVKELLVETKIQLNFVE